MSTKTEYRCSQSRVRFMRRVYDWCRSVGGELAAYESWRQESLDVGESCSFSDMHPVRSSDSEASRSYHPEYLVENEPLYFLPNYCSGSDYSGSSVEASNHRLLVEEYGDMINEMWGDFGSYGVAIPVSVLFDYSNERSGELRELFKRLADYPVIDEEDMSRLEMEWSDEGWESWAKRDFERALAVHLGVDDIEWDDNVDESDIRQCFESWRESCNVYWESENSGMHVDIERVVKSMSTDLDDVPKYGHCKPLSELLSVGTIAEIRGTGIEWDDVRAELETQEWERSEWDEELETRRVFIGTVFNLSPSGKYYTPWANSNVTEREALIDEAWWSLLEREAGELNLCVESGEGDPCDIFVAECRDKKDCSE